MDKRSRAYKLYQVGLEAYEPDTVPLVHSYLLQSIAAMIAEATKKKSTKKCSHECDDTCTPKKLLYTEQAVLACLNYELAVTKHGALNRQLSSMSLRDDDLQHFENWFRDIMYPWMQSKDDFEFTYSMLTRKYPEWLEKARQYTGVAGTSEPEKNWR